MWDTENFRDIKEIRCLGENFGKKNSYIFLKLKNIGSVKAAL